MHPTADSVSWVRQLTPSARSLVERRLRSYAVRQLAMVQTSGAGVVHAPTLDERMCAAERAREELEQLEQAAELFRELFGRDLLEAVHDEISRVTPPRSWLEASAAQLALSVASGIDLGLPGPFAQVTRRALVAQAEHTAAARAAICDACERAHDAPEQAARDLQHWLQVGLESLDADELRAAYLTQLEREARSLGLAVNTAPWSAPCH
jgi:1,2-phenylacetyl-CoA epoxidase catalytic subunit